MPRSCAVKSCNSTNIASRYSFFSFPNKWKHPNVFKCWVEFCGISQSSADIYINKNSRICELHFEKLCFNFGKYKTLKRNAVPTITNLFNSQENNTDVVCSSDLNKDIIENNKVLTYKEILEHCINRYNSLESTYSLRIIEEGFILCILNSEEPFNNIFTLKIALNKSVNFLNGNGILPRKLFMKFFTKPYFISSIDSFDNLCDFISGNVGSFEILPKSDKSFIKKSDFEEKFHPLIDFFEEQIILLNVNPKGRRFSANLLIWSIQVLLKSRSVYRDLKNFFVLPSERTFRKLTYGVGQSVNNKVLNEKYLFNQSGKLNDHEKIISLKFDEIQIKKRLDFRGDNLFGVAENESNAAAQHVQAFMIRSLKSNYKEIVRLVPVYKQNSDFLMENLLDVIDTLERTGFHIVLLTSDNSSINSNVIRNLTNNGNQSFFYSKNHPDRKIFILFDAPHLIKCIRNCWINCRTEDKTFFYPSFDNIEIVSRASFTSLEKLYFKEQHLLRMGYKLNSKAIFPSSIERQNVNLALKIFDPSTAAALNCIFPNEQGTCNFINLICRFWNIFNINNFSKGFKKNCKDSEPFFKINDPRLSFLEDFASFLSCWEKSNFSGKLSKQTFFALRFSVTSIIKLIKHLILDLNFKFVLTNYFQTDCLESTFGIYRQSNGGSFHISYMQILDAEKKNRLKNMIMLNEKIVNSDNYSFADNSAHQSLRFDDLNIKKSHFKNFDLPLIESATYIGGYILKKLKASTDCENCLYIFIPSSSEIVDDIKNEYLNYIDRGFLETPSKFLVQIVLVCTVFFEKYVANLIKYKKFGNKTTLDLFYEIIKYLGMLDDIIECEDHVNEMEFLITKILKIISNILLNNFCKDCNKNSKTLKPSTKFS